MKAQEDFGPLATGINTTNTPNRAWTRKIKRIQMRLFVTTITRKDILQKTIPNLKKTRVLEKTNIGLSHFHSDNWY